MKKVSGLLLLILMFPCYAQAKWSYEVNGYASGLYGFSSLEHRFKKFEHHHQGSGDFQLNTSAIYTHNDDYSISLNADFMSGLDHNLKNYSQGSWGEEVYAIIDAPAGRLMIGQTSNVASQFHQGAPSIGAISTNDSRIVDFVSNPNWTRNKKTASFATLNSTAINTDGTAPKLSYITPEFYNTLVGFSYIPDAYSRTGLINKFAKYSRKEGYVGSIYHSLDIGWGELSALVSYATYHNDDKEFSAGAQLKTGGWTIGGSWRRTYIEGRDSRRISISQERTPYLFDNYREGKAWDLGISYEIGPYSTSLAYFDAMSDRTSNRSQILLYSNQYQINKYLDFYLGGGYVRFQGNTKQIDDNRTGWVMLTGLSLNF